MLGRSIGIGVIQGKNGIFEGKEHPRVDFEAEMQIDRAVACFFRVHIDFPQLTQRISLDEVTFVVHVETMVNGMALQVCDKACYVDNSHEATLPFERVPTHCHI